jgi:hypothetical protein
VPASEDSTHASAPTADKDDIVANKRSARAKRTPVADVEASVAKPRAKRSTKKTRSSDADSDGDTATVVELSAPDKQGRRVRRTAL